MDEFTARKEVTRACVTLGDASVKNHQNVRYDHTSLFEDPFMLGATTQLVKFFTQIGDVTYDTKTTP